jgi:4-aminobutyrate aminotransferase/(S)-3-amino-2-methylpropionate transaminase
MVEALPRATDAAAVPQHRRLVTAVPGPRSRELTARRTAAVPPGVGTALPVFVERAGGGVLVDVDGSQLVDLGSGSAVTSVGNAAPDVVAGVSEQVAEGRCSPRRPPPRPRPGRRPAAGGG